MTIRFSKFVAALLYAELAMGLVCCSSSKGTDSPIAHIRVGRGGGFTGAYSGYELRAGGAIYQWRRDHSGRDTLIFLTTLPDSVDFYFGRARELRLAQLEFSHPWDLTEFVDIDNGTTVHTVRWGDPKVNVGSEVAEFYADVMAMASRTLQ